MRKKNCLFIIDPQRDFCNPEGALYVKGAEGDIYRLARFIKENTEEIDNLVVTLDTHQINDISHPNFWKDDKGNSPAPFTTITYNDLLNGKWIPKFEKAEALNYLKTLEEQKEYPHIIWPVHCLSGSKGACIDKNILTEIVNWSIKTDRMYFPVIKGLNPMCEHFGAFQAQVPIDGDNSTQFNIKLFNELSSYSNIFIAGEAKSHCVANTIKQMINHDATIAKKLIILEDTMSDVIAGETNLGFLGKPTFDKAKELGARFVTHNFSLNEKIVLC